MVGEHRNRMESERWGVDMESEWGGGGWTRVGESEVGMREGVRIGEEVGEE